MNTSLVPAVPGLGWSDDLLSVDGEAPVGAVLRQLDETLHEWVVITRHGGVLLYAFSARELRERLAGRARSDAEPLSAALRLHETQASTRVDDSAKLAPIDRSWRPDETSPSVGRYVEVDASGAPVAVGGADVVRRTLVRGRRRGGQRALPPSRDPFASDAEPLDTAAEPHEAMREAEPQTPAAPREPVPPLPPAAAPLEATQMQPQAAEPVGAAPPAEVADEGTTPVRHPSIESAGALRPGERVTLIVDLRCEASPTTRGDAIAFGAQPAGWTTLPVGVTLVSAGIDFDAGGRGQVTIRRNAGSIVAEIGGRVLATQQAGDEIDVLAQFWTGTRCSGSAQRTFVVAAAAGHEAPQAAPTVGTMQADPAADKPDLTIYITLFDRSAPGRMHWRVVTEPFDGLPPRLDGLIDLGQDPGAEAATMFKQFATLERGKHRARIEGFGERLWDLAPAEFRAAYWALNDHLQRPLTIQFSSDDPHLPWELMRPYRDGEVHPLLAERHAVARWIGRYQGWMSNRLPAGRLVAIAPKYRSASARLSLAEATAEALKAELAAERVDGTVAALRALLEQPPTEKVALLYFSGHGLFDTASAAASAIKLEDGNLAVDEVGRREVRLGERDGTLVFFNACEVGATAATLGDVGGWASVFLSRRFRGFIAPLWAIDEEDAVQVTRELMTRIVKEHGPIGAALRDLRARHGDESPTFLSYLLFGDVTASFPAA